jgi:hypothetical protein
MTRGSIYQARSKTSNKSYIGQTQDTKERDGKPYRYGVSGRWSDHVSSSFRGAKTPLANAIMELGADDFELITLESNVPEEMLDEREAHWISTLKTTVPNGFNVMRHARCKHRENTTLAEHYVPTTTKVRITSVKRGGENKLVYVYLEQTEDESIRLVFGQGTDATYASALLEAQDFVAIFAEYGIEVYEEESDDPLRKYREKIESIRTNKVERVRIAKFNHLVALYIKHNEGTMRICFGGKTISQLDAYKTALMVKDLIMEMHTSAILKDDMSESVTGDRH